MEMKVAVFAYQPEYLETPIYQTFAHGTDALAFGSDYTLVDADATVTFIAPDERGLISKQIDTMRKFQVKADIDAHDKKRKLEDRIAKLSALTWEKL